MRKLLQFRGDCWWPRFNKRGQLLFGNTSVYLWDGDLKLIQGETENRTFRNARWFTDDQIVYQECDKEGNILRVHGIDADPRLVEGNWFEANGGHWASVRAADRRLVVDGVIYPRPGYGLSMDWPWLMTAVDDNKFDIYRDKIYVETVTINNANFFAIQHGIILHSDGLRPYADGKDIGIGIQEGLPKYAELFWTSGYDNRGYLIGRPVDSQVAIILEDIEAKSFDVFVGDSTYLIAASSGPEIVILEISKTHPRRIFLMEKPSMNPPGVEIVRYSRVMTPDWSIEWKDRNNPGFEGSVHFHSGSVHVTIRNPVGMDTSAKTRPVIMRKSYEDFFRDVQTLDDFYRTGLKRTESIFNDPGALHWIYALMTDDISYVISQIKQSDEYREKNQNGFRPTLEEISSWSGDFLDALNNFSAPTFMLPGMPNDMQHRILANYPGTHVPFGWKTFYPKFPQWTFDRPNDIEEVIELCLHYHKIPVLFIPIEENDSLDKHVERIRPILRRIDDSGLLFALSWGWEINDINSWTANGSEQLRYLQKLREITSVPLYVHFTPERWSGWPSFDGTEQDKSELSWLIEARKIGIEGLLYQEPYDKKIPYIEERAFLLDKKNYMNPGIKGRVETAGLQFIMFEHSRDPEHYKAVVDLCKKYNVGYC
jgi:hypothetical protein